MSAVYLVRHGQASFGAADYDQLSALGEQQARVLGQVLATQSASISRVASGGMRRHRQTAQAALAAMGRPGEWQEDAGWNEFDHVALVQALHPDPVATAGLRETLMAAPDPKRAFQAVFEQAMARWVSGEYDADYPETWAAFRARCSQALERLLDGLPRGDDALVFTSGGPIATLAQGLLQSPDDAGVRLSWGLVNCGVTKLVRGGDGIRLSTLNGHAHFEGPHAALITYR